MTIGSTKKSKEKSKIPEDKLKWNITYENLLDRAKVVQKELDSNTGLP